MKHPSLTHRPLVLGSLLAATLASAQTADLPYSVKLSFDQEAAASRKNRFGLSYRGAWNVSAKFSRLGGMNLQNDPGPLTSGANHEYDNGYVRVDSTHNGLGLTWNWGFDSAAQVMGDNLVLQSSRALADGVEKAGDSAMHHGMELTYARQLGTWRRLRWGVEAALNWMPIGIRDSDAAFSSRASTIDTWPLGIDPFQPPPAPPGTPNQGTFFGPGPLIDDVPAARDEQITPRGAAIDGDRRFEADVFGMRLGPYVEIPVWERLSLTFAGGLALASVHGDFQFSENVTSEGLTPESHAGSGSESEVLAGFFVGGNLVVALNEQFSLTAGAEFQHLGRYSQDVNGKRAEIDFGKSIVLKAGLNFSF